LRVAQPRRGGQERVAGTLEVLDDHDDSGVAGARGRRGRG
jgi:hypothetical protein